MSFTIQESNIIFPLKAPIETPPTNYSAEGEENTSNVTDSTADETTEEEVIQPTAPAEVPDKVEEEPAAGKSFTIP